MNKKLEEDYNKLLRNLLENRKLIQTYEIKDKRYTAGIYYSHTYNQEDILFSIDYFNFKDWQSLRDVLDKLFEGVDESNIRIIKHDYAYETLNYKHRYSLTGMYPGLYFEFLHKYTFEQRKKCYRYWMDIDKNDADFDKIIALKNFKGLEKKNQIGFGKACREYKRLVRYEEKLKALPKFHKDYRGNFKYWASHWKAFQMTALYYKCWKFKYLFHDIEKPFLMLLWNNDYKRVQKWHREHNRHHMEYKGKRGIDYTGMAIDFECSRFTKLDAQWDAYDTWKNLYPDNKELGNKIFNLFFYQENKGLKRIK